MEVALDLVKIIVPASIVLYAVFLIVRSFINKEIQLRQLEIRSRSIETVLPARLQAYERMTLFLERMSPQNLLVRINAPGITAREFQRMLLDEIRNEYNHNVSQQVYISEEVWTLIRNAKEDLVLQINEASSQVPPDSTSIELAKRVFELVLNRNVDAISHALVELKKEIQRTF